RRDGGGWVDFRNGSEDDGLIARPPTTVVVGIDGQFDLVGRDRIEVENLSGIARDTIALGKGDGSASSKSATGEGIKRDPTVRGKLHRGVLDAELRVKTF